MGNEEDIKRVLELLVQWITKIKVHSYLDFYDINQVAEDLAVSLLNEIYGLHLVNLNREKKHYPGIDLPSTWNGGLSAGARY